MLLIGLLTTNDPQALAGSFFTQHIVNMSGWTTVPCPLPSKLLHVRVTAFVDCSGLKDPADIGADFFKSRVVTCFRTPRLDPCSLLNCGSFLVVPAAVVNRNVFFFCELVGRKKNERKRKKRRVERNPLGQLVASRAVADFQRTPPLSGRGRLNNQGVTHVHLAIADFFNCRPRGSSSTAPSSLSRSLIRALIPSNCFTIPFWCPPTRLH